MSDDTTTQGGDTTTDSGTATPQADEQYRVILPGGVEVGAGTVEGRPGGEPQWKAEITALRNEIGELTRERQEGVAQRHEGKDKADTADARIAALETQVRRGALAEQASAAGARDPFLVASLLDGSDDPAIALTALRQSHGYMFGGQSTPRGHDMNGGETPGGTPSGPSTDLGKFITERFG